MPGRVPDEGPGEAELTSSPSRKGALRASSPTASPDGVLLVQLGSPDAPTPRALRRFLRVFLSDRRVVDLNPVFWGLLLHGIILRVRPRKSAALYERIWTPKGSPLIQTSEAQQRGVAARLGDGIEVELGMRYGRPGLGDALDRLQAAGCRSIVVLPLFPQYSSATTASVFDALAAWAKGRRDVPAFTFIRSFADHPAWIGSVVREVEAAGVIPTAKAPLLFSFHGIPQRYADEGDPYPRECEATAVGVARALGLPDEAWRVVYQSRFGREKWLGPALDETLRALPGEGIRRVAVATPSFVADCLETLDEVGRVSKSVFEAAGGRDFRRVRCPNDSPEMLACLAEILGEVLPERGREPSPDV